MPRNPTVYQSSDDWGVACNICGATIGNPCVVMRGDRKNNIAEYFHRGSRERHLVETGRIKTFKINVF
jgi:hypothetical protein